MGKPSQVTSKIPQDLRQFINRVRENLDSIEVNADKTANANHTGDMSGNKILTAQPAIITGKPVLASGLAEADQLLLDDNGVLKRIPLSLLDEIYGRKPAVTAEIATTSLLFHDITGIPAWVTKIVLLFDQVSTSATSQLALRLRGSGAFETTAYTSSVADGAGRTTNATRFVLSTAVGAAGDLYIGTVTLYRMDATTNKWLLDGHLNTDISEISDHHSTGKKSITGDLTEIRLFSVSGTATFDGGLFAARWS